MIERVVEMGASYIKVPFYQVADRGMDRKAILNEYEYTLLENTKIPGIAKVSKRLEDGNEKLLYLVSSCVSLENRMSKDELDEEMFLDFFRQLMKVYEKIQSYLLDFEAVNLNPEHIFYDEEKKLYIFLIGYIDNATIVEKFEMLLTFFADVCPIGRQELLEYIFELFGSLSEEKYEVYSFMQKIIVHQFEDPMEEELDVCMFDEETDINELSEKAFEKKKSMSIYIVSICFLILSVFFAFFVKYEFKYCIVSMVLSLMATGFMSFSVVRTVKYGMKIKST